MTTHCFTGSYEGLLTDKRIEKRVEISMAEMLHSGTSIINKAMDGLSQKIATYRMLSNRNFNHDDILQGSFKRCINAIDVEHVLCIQDTTEFNYYGIKDKLKKSDPDIGPTSSEKIPGFFCHPMLITDTKGSQIYGLTSTLIFNRDWEQKSKNERNYKKIPIEDKESYKWLLASQETKQRIPQNVILTIIGDRESDIYEDFERIPDERTHLLIRCSSDRILANKKEKLYEKLEAQEVSGQITVKIKGNKNRKKRTSTLEIKFCKVEIKAPANKKHKTSSIPLYAIQAKEIGNNIPDNEDPILWRLLTTHKIDTIEDAIQCIEWYKTRWLIEELFRVIKTKGFCIESSQLSTGFAIKKLIARTLEVAMHVMQMKLARTSNSQIAVERISSDKQIILLKILLIKVEGTTEKQKNPYPKLTLSWAAWIIARLGSWSGYKSHGPPGYITMKNGFDKFNNQFEIFNLIS
jgi:hypothetical protein